MGLSAAHASALFDSDDVIEFSLSGPLGTVLEEREEETEREFVFRTDGEEQQIKVRVRGNSRKRVCEFAPLRLDFGGNAGEESVFAGQGRLKLVTHCDSREWGNRNLLREYAAYRIFNVISEAGFKVRLARIEYSDEDGMLDETTFERFGFLVESVPELAERLGGQAAEVAGVSLSSLDLDQAASVFIFQYLIANTDWSFVAASDDSACCHNGDLIEVDSQRYYVPYDFDMSGLVNAGYAAPDPSLRISRVTQRLYRGYCIAPEPLLEALARIIAQRNTILAEIERIPHMAASDVARTVEFLDGFFKQAVDEERLLRTFERSCL